MLFSDYSNSNIKGTNVRLLLNNYTNSIMMMMMHTHSLQQQLSKFKRSILGCTLWLIYCVRTLHTNQYFQKD